MTGRPGQTITFNDAGMVSRVVAGSVTQDTVYNVDGSILLRTNTAEGASLFVGDTVLSQAAGSSVVAGWDGVGDYFITKIDTTQAMDDERLMSHEQAHSNQWAGFHADYPALYARFEMESNLAGLGPACGNYFEYSAGLSGGHYAC